MEFTARKLCVLLAAVFAATATTVRAAVPLVQLNATTYQTEHCLFIIDASVHWNSPTQAYNDIYGASGGTFPLLQGYFDTLTARFPANYFSVCYIANTGASPVPNYIDRIYKADGIQEPGAAGAPQSFSTVDICRYNLPGGAVYGSVLAVYDHELGHAWGAQLFNNLNPPALSNGHWLANSTVDCQLSATYSDDSLVTVNKIYGDAAHGFRWQRVDNLRSNDTELFSEQELYLMGAHPTFPTSYVLNTPVYNADHTMGFSSVDTFDHAAAVAQYGARNPDYKTSAKRFKLGFVYIARDLAEVNTVYQAVEQAVVQFCDGEAIDTAAFRFQVPFVVDARFRASVDGLLSDLDGNATPTLTVSTSYVSSTDGAATISFVAADAGGATPGVSVVPASTHCVVGGGNVTLTGLPDGVHFFTLRATDAGGKKAWAHFVVEVQRPASSLSLATQPGDVTVTAGAAASFNISLNGSPSGVTYQWMRQAAGTSTWNDLSDDASYSGTHGAMLTVTSSTTMNGDRLLCFVSSFAGAVTSANATLMVNETAPMLTSATGSQTVVAGNVATFSVVPAGAPATYGYFRYQWQRMTSGGAWTDLVDGTGGVSGATSSRVSVAGTTAAMDGDQFRCNVSNTAGTTTSAVATLSIIVRPSITTQPTSVTASAGQNVTLQVAATGTAPLSYQWYLYGAAVTGGTSAALTLSDVQSTDAGAYTVKVTNTAGTATSNVGSVTVNSAAPTITSSPQAASVSSGQTATFSVAATGTTPFTYQWRKNGTTIPGATASSYAIPNAQASDAGDYSVVVTNSVGSATSASATLAVTAPPAAPGITAQPTSMSVVAGQSATFTVTATGTAPLAYQWRKHGGPISGATSATLTLANAQAGDAGTYSVVITNSLGSITSADATLTVTAQAVAPSVTTPPQSTTLTAGQAFTLSVSVAGTAPFTYQWQKDHADLPGATSSTFSVATAQVSDAGDYTVTITNSAGSITSVAATVAVNAAPIAPSITNAPQSLAVTAGQSAIFTVTAIGSGPLGYSWLKDGAVLPNQANPTLTLANAQLSDAGSYTVLVSNSAGSALSAAATLTVHPAPAAPTISTQPVSLSVAHGSDATFTVGATGTPAPTYQWEFNGAAISGATNSTLTVTNVSLAAAGHYTVLVANSAGSVRSAEATLTIFAADYTGTYYGQFANGGGDFMLVVRGNGNNALLINLAGRKQAVVAGGVAVDADGKFNVGLPADAHASLSSNDPRIYSGQVTGSINAGALALNVPALSLSASVSRTSSDASLASRAGFYQSLPLGQSNGELYALVGEDGAAYVLEFDADTPRANRGSVTVDGSLHVTIASGAAVQKDYSLTISGGQLAGSVTDASGTSTVQPAPVVPNNEHLINLSSLGTSGAGDKTLIAGFVITGSAPKDVLIRAVGPRLADFGITGALADPKLALFQGAAQVASNDNWEAGGNAADIVSTSQRVGAFSLNTGSTDAVLLAHLSAGNYSAQVTSTEGSGVAIVELYDAGPTGATAPRLINISTRGEVGKDNAILIAGFVVTGDAPKKLLLRGVGPSLAQFGVGNLLANPKLRLFKGQTFIKENDDWDAGGDAALIASAATAVGAFALPSGSKDAAMAVYLEPGNYSVQVSGVGNTTGVALVEVYEVGN